MNFMKMCTFYKKKLPLFVKNSILHTYINSNLKMSFKNSIFGTNRDPCREASLGEKTPTLVVARLYWYVRPTGWEDANKTCGREVQGPQGDQLVWACQGAQRVCWSHWCKHWTHILELSQLCPSLQEEKFCIFARSGWAHCRRVSTRERKEGDRDKRNQEKKNYYVL